MPKPIDLTGKKFEGLIVIASTTNKFNRTEWVCMCECGALFLRRRDQIQKGQLICRSSVHKGLTYKDGYALKWAPTHPRAERPP